MANQTFTSKTRLNKEQGAEGGPTDALYKSDYDFEGLYYPRNLGETTRGHYIIFYINVSNNSTYTKKGASYSGSQTRGGYTDVGYVGAAGRGAINQATAAKQTSVGIAGDVMDSLTVRKTKRITQAVALYMPDTVNVSYNANWQTSSLTDALGKLGSYGNVLTSAWDAAKEFAAKATLTSSTAARGIIAETAAKALEGQGLTAGGTTDFALFTQGLAVNPQLEVLFKGTDMREFQFDFLFSPHSAEEAENVVNIIKTFKFHQAPEVNYASTGRYFIVPSEFDIDFFKDGQINDRLHQIGTVVLKGMNVDYAPNGWSTFENGMPTQIRLTLQFQETEIVTKDLVERYNY